MMISALWQVASRQWGTHRLRVALTTLGIALGVAVFFAIRTANAALLDSLTLTVERLAGKSTLEVTAGETGFPEKILDIVRDTPGVQLAEPVIEVIARTAIQDEGNLLILGVDTTGDQQLRQYEFDQSQTQIADPLTYLAQPNSILLSRAFAERHGLQIGDPSSHLHLARQNGFHRRGDIQAHRCGRGFRRQYRGDGHLLRAGCLRSRPQLRSHRPGELRPGSRWPRFNSVCMRACRPELKQCGRR